MSGALTRVGGKCVFTFEFHRLLTLLYMIQGQLLRQSNLREVRDIVVKTSRLPVLNVDHMCTSQKQLTHFDL